MEGGLEIVQDRLEGRPLGPWRELGHEQTLAVVAATVGGPRSAAADHVDLEAAVDVDPDPAVLSHGLGMRIVSWNVNSVRVRLEAIRRFVRKYEPDVLCLQETKVEDHLFPREAFARMGFANTIVAGQKGYHGVAIATRRPVSSHHQRRIGGRRQARHVAIEVDGIEIHDVYVPAGGERPDPEQNPAFAYKLRFLRSMARWMRSWPNDVPRVLVGDLNVAPLETDVWSHQKLRRVITHTEVEIEHLAAVQRSCGWVDAARSVVPPSEKLFTWWSHRGDWRRLNKGRRLDHIWVTPTLEKRIRDVKVATEVRGWRRPSDHAPLFVDLDTR